jgi:hypothetical protein
MSACRAVVCLDLHVHHVQHSHSSLHIQPSNLVLILVLQTSLCILHIMICYHSPRGSYRGDSRERGSSGSRERTGGGGSGYGAAVCSVIRFSSDQL